jgi:hypothetical protein
MFQGFKSKREEKVLREAAFEIYEKNQLKNILKKHLPFSWTMLEF